MKFPSLFTSLLALVMGAFVLNGCKNDSEKPATGSLNFEFENVVGGQTLTLGQSYNTLEGDQITVTKFNYIISNIQLTKADGSKWSEPESYHLVKQTDNDSRTFEIKGIPLGDYKQLTFTIGVDSARNTAGAQTGALDTGNDMYWGWSSGYIFLKIEGTSPQSSTGRYVYHVGGFRKPYNTIQTVSPAMPAGTPTFTIKQDVAPEIHLQAEVQKIFTGPNHIRLAQLNDTGMSADPKSMLLAANYAAGMFSIAHIHPGN